LYLGVAGVFGLLNGMLDIGYFGVFAHTHFNLLGFMSMMIYGVGYFILPRFNGRDLRFGSWVPLHFWLGNASLIGMVVFRGLEVSSGETTFTILFVVSAAIQLLTLFMFIINIWMTLADSQVPVSQNKPQAPPAKPAPAPPKKRVVVTPDSRVADLVDAQPSIQQILIEAGLRSLAMPGHIDKVRMIGVTLGMACTNHGLDLDRVILKIEEEFRRNGFEVSAPFDVPVTTGTAPHSQSSAITAQSLVGEVIENNPGTRSVFQKYFGAGCFECPGQAYESLDMACRMHGVDPEQFMAELKETAG